MVCLPQILRTVRYRRMEERLVRLKNRLKTSIVLAIAVMTASTAGAWPRRHGQKMRVRFLATSTLLRGTWGLNEDTYLAQVLFPKQNEAILARLVDSYPSEWPSLSRQLLTSDAGAFLALKRDAACDQPFSEILLRTPPGDLMAILPEPLGYQPALERPPAPGSVLPCYRILRR